MAYGDGSNTVTQTGYNTTSYDRTLYKTIIVIDGYSCNITCPPKFFLAYNGTPFYETWSLISFSQIQDVLVANGAGPLAIYGTHYFTHTAYDGYNTWANTQWSYTITRDAAVFTDGTRVLYDTKSITNENIYENYVSYIYSGGSFSSSSVRKGGSVYLYTGSVLSGNISVAGTLYTEGTVSASSANIVFSVDQRQTTDSYIISNIANISNANYSITVSANQMVGTYRLAAGASNFNKNIILKDNNSVLGTFAYNSNSSYNVINVGNKQYSIQQGSELYLIVGTLADPNIRNFAALCDDFRYNFDKYYVKVKFESFSDKYTFTDKISLSVSAITVKAEYQTNESSPYGFYLYGKVDLKLWNTTVSIDFSEASNNYILLRTDANFKKITDGDVKGRFSVSSIDLKIFQIDNVSVSVDTTSNSYSFVGAVALEKLSKSITVKAEASWINGQWDSIALEVSGLKINIAGVVYFKSIEATVSGLSDSSTYYTAKGEIGFGIGLSVTMPEIKILGIKGGSMELGEVLLGGSYHSNGDFSVNGAVSLFEGNIFVKGNFTHQASTHNITINGDMNLFNVVTVTAKAIIDNNSFYLRAAAEVESPAWFSSIFGNRVRVSVAKGVSELYIVDNNSANSYFAYFISVLGKERGQVYYFDGRVKKIGLEELEKLYAENKKDGSGTVWNGLYIDDSVNQICVDITMIEANKAYSFLVINEDTGEFIYSGVSDNVQNFSMSKNADNPNFILEEASFERLMFTLKNPNEGNLVIKITSFDGSDIDADFEMFKYTQEVSADDDIWGKAPTLGFGESVTDEWVGFGDKIDYRAVELTANGSYDFEVSGLTNAVKLTLWTVNAAGIGLTSVKTITITPKFDRDGNIISGDRGALTGLLLDSSKPYFVSVDAIGAATGKNSAYQLEFTGVTYATPDRLDDSAWLARRQDLPRSNAIFSDQGHVDFVGFGDLVDVSKLDITQNGRYSFSLNGIEIGTGITLTVYSLTKGTKLAKIGGITVTGKSGVNSANLNNLLLSNADNVEYYIEVKSTTGAKGLNTNYTLTGTENKLYTAEGAYSTIDTAKEWGYEGANFGWVGYGDTVDYYKLNVDTAGNYTFVLSDVEIKSAVKYTLYRAFYDGKGGQGLQSICSGTATLYDGYSYGVMPIPKDLLSGTYYIKVECFDTKGDSKNSNYAITAVSNNFENLQIGEIAARTKITQIIEVSGYQTLQFTSITGLTLYSDNGKNGRTNIALVKNRASGLYEVTLAQGTYYLATNGNNSASNFSTVDVSENFGTVSLNDNVYQNASTLVDNKATGWVGYGDAKDFYEFTVANGEAGAYTFTLSDAVSGNAKLTLYRINIDAKGGQTLVSLGNFTYTNTKNLLTIANLLSGNYYIAVESTSANKAVGAKNSDYMLNVSSTNYALFDDAGVVTLDRNQYAQFVTEGDKEDIYRLDLTGKNYAVYVNNGKNGFSALTVTNGSVLLNGNTAYYIKSTLNNNLIRTVFSQVNTVDSDLAMKFNEVKVNNQIQLDSINGWVELNNGADEYFFNTFEGGVERGWATFNVSDISNTLANSTRLTLELYRELNGKRTIVTGVTAVYTLNTKTGLYTLTTPNLGANLLPDTDYKLLVKTSDNGKGVCAGNYEITGSVDIYDFSNNNLAAATNLSGIDAWESNVVKSGDNMDFFELADWDDFFLDVAAGGSVKLTFFDEKQNLVKVGGVLNGKASTNSAFTVAYNANANNSIEFTAGDLSLAAFVKIEAVGASNNHYQIGQIA